MDSPIVLIDSDDKRCEQRRSLLESLGYKVVTCDNGLTASEAVSRESPCLIVSEIQLTKLSGPDVLRLARKNQVELPAVLIGSKSDSVVKLFEKMKGVFYLDSDPSEGDLRKAVKEALPQAQKEGCPVDLGRNEVLALLSKLSDVEDSDVMRHLPGDVDRSFWSAFKSLERSELIFLIPRGAFPRDLLSFTEAALRLQVRILAQGEAGWQTIWPIEEDSV